MRIEVADNGDGEGAEFAASPSTGVGLANIRDRLAQAYGAAHAFTTRKNERGGFSVIIEIPFESGDNESMSIRTILVDDEPLATQGLQLRLQAHDDVEVVGTAANGREAIRAIKTHKPDLVFLDIQMPGFDGFSVIQGLMEVEPPLFVFVTAYGDHALRAFDAQAVDYLMKPVDEDRLAETLDRVRQRLSGKARRRGGRAA